MARLGRRRRNRARPKKASSFRWPARERAIEAERRGALAAQRALDRLRQRRVAATEDSGQTEAGGSRATRFLATAAGEDRPPPSSARARVTGPQAPSRSQDETDEQPTLQEHPEDRDQHRPAPGLWQHEFDELTERLVAELRRDLGPEDGGPQERP